MQIHFFLPILYGMAVVCRNWTQLLMVASPEKRKVDAAERYTCLGRGFKNNRRGLTAKHMSKMRILRPSQRMQKYTQPLHGAVSSQSVSAVLT